MAAEDCDELYPYDFIVPCSSGPTPRHRYYRSGYLLWLSNPIKQCYGAICSEERCLPTHTQSVQRSALFYKVVSGKCILKGTANITLTEHLGCDCGITATVPPRGS